MLMRASDKGATGDGALSRPRLQLFLRRGTSERSETARPTKTKRVMRSKRRKNIGFDDSRDLKDRQSSKNQGTVGRPDFVGSTNGRMHSACQEARLGPQSRLLCPNLCRKRMSVRLWPCDCARWPRISSAQFKLVEGCTHASDGDRRKLIARHSNRCNL
jgi:hypothetical protein